MSRSRRHILVAVAIAACWPLPGHADSSESLQTLWLRAESETDSRKAVILWEKLAGQDIEIAAGVTPQDAHRRLFSAYLEMDNPEKAAALLDNLEEKERIFAALLLARKEYGKDAGKAWRWVAQAARQALTMEDDRSRSFSLYAVALTAVLRDGDAPVFRWDGPQLTQTLIPQITVPRHRAHIMHLHALAGEEPQGKWEAGLFHALRLPREKRDEALEELYLRAQGADLFLIARDAVSGMTDETRQQKILYDWFKEECDREEYSRAVSLAQRLAAKPAAAAWAKLAVAYHKDGQDLRAQEAMRQGWAAVQFVRKPGEQAKAWLALAKAYAEQGAFDDAAEAARRIGDKDLRKEADAFLARKRAQHSGKRDHGKFYMGKMGAQDKIHAGAALKKLQQGAVAEGARSLREIKNARFRARQFRHAAKMLAERNDAYGFLGGSGLSVPDPVRKDAVAPIPVKSKTGVEISLPPVSRFGKEIPPLPEAEKLRLSVAVLRARLPLPEPFQVRRAYYENNFFINRKFMVAIGHAEANQQEKMITPEIIFLQSGTATLPQIYDAMRAQGVEDYLIRQGKSYTLRRGLLVGKAATLMIDGAEVDDLRQSKQHGAIIVNAGNLHITGTRVAAWDEEHQTPARADYETRYDFRPFIASWSGSHTWLGGNEMIGLGYSNHKSYGVSFSSGPKKMQVNALYEPARPDGAIVDNSFDNMYYGFYSYEADNAALVGNEYRGNIIYGIDPHDRSRNLTIAYNTAYDSRKKHGIIISREVDDSSYIGNLCFDNHGSGFMIDRQSRGTYVYANTAFGNGQDGLTLFESGCNLIASNDFSHNKWMGIRLRNSRDNAMFANNLTGNGQGGFYGYVSDLRTDAAHAKRNFLLDPYRRVAAAALMGNHIENNAAGVLADDMTALYLRANRFIDQAPKLLQGKWFRDYPWIASQYDLENRGVLIRESCLQDSLPSDHCRFRDQGVFEGDGQENLTSMPRCEEAS